MSGRRRTVVSKQGITPYAGVFETGKEVTFELKKEELVPKRFSFTTEGGEDMIINVILKEGDSVEEEKAAAAEPAETLWWTIPGRMSRQTGRWAYCFHPPFCTRPRRYVTG